MPLRLRDRRLPYATKSLLCSQCRYLRHTWTVGVIGACVHHHFIIMLMPNGSRTLCFGVAQLTHKHGKVSTVEALH
jgi:hypothetical protein